MENFQSSLGMIWGEGTWEKFPLKPKEPQRQKITKSLVFQALKMNVNLCYFFQIFVGES